MAAVKIQSSPNQFYGVHADDKPLDVEKYSLFFELDTGDVYYFDGSAWQSVGGA